MALCSYDNELNQKYNFNKGFKMATPAQKKAQDAKAKEVETVEESKDMNILEAHAVAEKVGKVARRGWSKELNSHFVTIKRGETKLSLSNGKHSSPFTPSYDDVFATDWYNVEEEV